MSKVNSVKALRAKRSKRLAQKRGLPQLKVVPTAGLGLHGCVFSHGGVKLYLV